MSYTPNIRLADEPDFFDRHYYIWEDRSQPVTPENISIRRLGAMVETLVDALHLVLLSNDPLKDLKGREVAFAFPKDMPPSYILETIGDYRAALSFFRRDKNRTEDPSAPLASTQSAQLPSPVKLAEELHRLSRNMGTRVGKLFAQMRWEGETFTQVKKLAKDYESKIKYYKDRIKLYGNSTKFAELAPKTYKDFNEKFGGTVAKLKERLGEIPSFQLDVNGTPYPVSNTEIMNPFFPNSQPARVIFAFQMAGKEGIDSDMHPRVGFQFLTDMFGVESDLMLVMDNLQRHLNDASGGDHFNFLENKYRQTIRKQSHDQAHGLQLLSTFHAIANRLPKLYPEGKQQIAFDDMAAFLAMAGRTPELDHFVSPKEVATMLYAVERRFADEGRGDHLRQGLRAYAQSISKADDMEALPPRFSNDAQFQRLLTQSRQLAEESAMHGPVASTLSRIQDLVKPTHAIAAQVENRRDSQERSVTG